MSSLDSPAFHVLIVDGSEECREVFRTILGQRGWSIMEAHGHQHGLDLVQRCRPHVVVLDVDADQQDGQTSRTCEDFRRASEAQHAALLVLGAQRRSQGLAEEQIVPKPYHYAPLIRKIEQLCRQSLEAERQG